MFGTLRFILASLVLTSHTYHKPSLPYQLGSEFHTGVFAVIGFYLISGYVMAHQTARFAHPTRPNTLLWFYLNRFLRIWPLYLTVFIAAALPLYLLGHLQLHLFGLIAHLTIFPLNYYTRLPVSLWTNRPDPLLYPTWSLATELHYYLLAPLHLYPPQSGQNPPHLLQFSWVCCPFLLSPPTRLLCLPPSSRYPFCLSRRLNSL